MSDLKETKKRIFSINSVIKTTEAMKMISIVKLKKNKHKLDNIKNYLLYIEKLLLDLFLLQNNDRKNFFNFFKKSKKKLFIVFTSDKGLCGSFNLLIFNNINYIIKKYDKYIFSIFGKKGIDFIEKKKYKIYYKNISIKIFITKIIEDLFNKKFSSIHLVYNTLKNSLYQKPIIENIFSFIKINNINKYYKKDYILDNSFKETFNFLIKNYIEIKLNKIYLESVVSENTSRMISMHKASENASNIKKNLILNYNKERQTSITKEILEIIGGLDTIKNL